MNKIAIVTDNTFINEELQKTNKNLKIIDLAVTLEDGRTIYKENGISDDEFYNILYTTNVTTSQPPIGVIEQKWESFLKEYDFLIIIGVTKKMSGTYSTQYQLAQSDKFKDKVIIINSESMSVVLEKMIIVALEFVKNNNNYENKIQLEKEINIEIDKIKKSYKCLIFPKSIDFLYKGGRISNLQFKLTNFLRLSPILEFKNGMIEKYGLLSINNYLKGISKQIKILLLKNKNNIDTGTVHIGYSLYDDKNFINKLVDSLKDFGFDKIIHVKIPKVILTHWGKNFLIINFWKK